MQALVRHYLPVGDAAVSLTFKGDMRYHLVPPRRVHAETARHMAVRHPFA
jgi:hypothetical protein